MLKPCLLVGVLSVGSGACSKPGAAPGDAAPDGDAGQDAALDARSDAPVDSGSDSSCAGLAYCEDFESYSITGPIATNTAIGPWTSAVHGAAVMTIDGVHPHSGTQALHITVPNGDTGAGALLNLTKAAGLITGNNLFGRAMVYYTKSATDDLPNGVHSWIFQGKGTSTESGKIMTLNLANRGTTYFLNYHGDSTSSVESSKSGGTPVAAQWVCMQWQYNSSGTPSADDAKVWVDGVLALEATKAGENWSLATPFSMMQFGFNHFQTLSNAIDVYLDDFAIDTAMIPCPP